MIRVELNCLANMSLARIANDTQCHSLIQKHESFTIDRKSPLNRKEGHAKAPSDPHDRAMG
jgi:hypothetical protein